MFRASSPAKLAPVHVAAVERKDFPVVLRARDCSANEHGNVRSGSMGRSKRSASKRARWCGGRPSRQIDPARSRLLESAIAKLAQDQASLTNGKQDLERTTILSKEGKRPSTVSTSKPLT